MSNCRGNSSAEVSLDIFSIFVTASLLRPNKLDLVDRCFLTSPCILEMDQARKDYTAIHKLMSGLASKRQEAAYKLMEASEEEWKQPYLSEVSYLSMCRQTILGVSIALGVASGKRILRTEGFVQFTNLWKAYVYVGLISAYDAVLTRGLMRYHLQVLNLLYDDYILEENRRSQG